MFLLYYSISYKLCQRPCVICVVVLFIKRGTPILQIVHHSQTSFYSPIIRGTINFVKGHMTIITDNTLRAHFDCGGVFTV